MTTETAFRTVYYIAKNNRPYTDHFDLIEMEKLNGIEIGYGLHSIKDAREIINHVSNRRKKRIVNKFWM